MTTTLSSSPGGHSTITQGSSAATRDGLVKAKRGNRLVMLFFPAVVLVGGLAWAVSSMVGQVGSTQAVDGFLVAPRSFNVVLNEKGELQAAQSTDVVCEVEGRSTIIYLIPEGAAVKEGDLLVELASDEIEKRIRQEELKEANAIVAFDAAKTELDIQRDMNESDIRKAELKIELRQLALNKYQKGDWEQSLKDANIEIERATIALEQKTEDYEAAKKLLAKDFMTQIAYNTKEFDFRKAQWDLEKAKKSLEVLSTYTHVADLRQRESDLAEAKKERDRTIKNADAEEAKKVGALEGNRKELALTEDELAKLREQKAKCKIYAPTQGFVVYFSGGGRYFMMGDNQIKEGASVHERQTLLSLPDTSEMIVKVRVHEANTDKLQLGQTAVVTVEGLPGQRFSGKVSKIAVLADSQNRWLNPDLKEYETEVKLDSTDATLKPGVTAHVEILVESVTDKIAIPVQSVYTRGGRRYVFSGNRGAASPIEIKLGAIGTEWAEITEGLSGGETILLAFSDEHKRLAPDLPPLAGSKSTAKDITMGAHGGLKKPSEKAKMGRGKGPGGKSGHAGGGKYKTTNSSG